MALPASAFHKDFTFVSLISWLMKEPAPPPREADRLSALRELNILDSPPEQAYDDLLAIAGGICGTPLGTVSLVDADRQWFKSKRGLLAGETPRKVSFCGHAILQPHEVMVVPDALEDERFRENPLVTGDPRIRFYAGSPVLNGTGLPMGTLCVMDREPRHLEFFQIEALRALSRQVGFLLELRRAHRALGYHIEEREWYEAQLESAWNELSLRNAELTEQSRTDALTGVANRRQFEDALAAALRQASLERGVALALVDIDHFKQINDSLGHAEGDRVLVEVARSLRAGGREGDLVARVGGEEFALLMPAGDRMAALSHCERQRERIAALNPAGPVTASLGLALWQPGDTAESLLRRADEALYTAKRSGRNRVC